MNLYSQQPPLITSLMSLVLLCWVFFNQTSFLIPFEKRYLKNLTSRNNSRLFQRLFYYRFCFVLKYQQHEMNCVYLNKTNVQTLHILKAITDTFSFVVRCKHGESINWFHEIPFVIIDLITIYKIVRFQLVFYWCAFSSNFDDFQCERLKYLA